jgi:hypothetical protein
MGIEHNIPNLSNDVLKNTLKKINMSYIIVITTLAIVFLLIGQLIQERILKNEKENTFLKNIQLSVGIATVLVGGHYSYREFIQKNDEKAKLPPVLNVRCKLEKVSESDTCYWLKAIVSYENKSERRINILFSSLSVKGFNIASPGEQTIPTAILSDQDYYYSRDFSYYKDQSLLYSLKTQSQNWYDFNQFLSNEYIIKIRKNKNEYDVASLTVSTAIANEKEFPGYILTDSIVNGIYTLNVYDTLNSYQKDIRLNDYEAFYALKEYGYGWVNTECQLYLKGPTK